MCPLPSRVESSVFPGGPLILAIPAPLYSLCRPLELLLGPSSLFAEKKAEPGGEEEQATPASALVLDMICLDPGAHPCGFRPWWRLWLSLIHSLHVTSTWPRAWQVTVTDAQERCDSGDE